MAEASPIDDRGRFTIDPKWRKKLGPRVVQIWTPHGLLLRPVSGKLRPGALPPSFQLQGDELYPEDEARKDGAR